jgi:hypothetical protein
MFANQLYLLVNLSQSYTVLSQMLQRNASVYMMVCSEMMMDKDWILLMNAQKPDCYHNTTLQLLGACRMGDGGGKDTTNLPKSLNSPISCDGNKIGEFRTSANGAHSTRGVIESSGVSTVLQGS